MSTLLLVGVQYSTSEKDGYPVSLFKPIAWMTSFASLLGVLLVLNNPFDASLLFNNLLVHDSFTNLVKVVLLLSTASCIFVSFDYIKTQKEYMHLNLHY